jgi:hypothetical protein
MASSTNPRLKSTTQHNVADVAIDTESRVAARRLRFALWPMGTSSETTGSSLGVMVPLLSELELSYVGR